jgi:lipopolysaccharide export system permease protein
VHDESQAAGDDRQSVHGRDSAAIAGLAVFARILGFVVQAACEGNVWLNVLQYAVPLIALGFALRSIFRQPTTRARAAVRSTARLRGATA